MSEIITPLADMLQAFGDQMPLTDRIANLKKVLESLHFCTATRDKETGKPDHDDCEPLTVLDGFFTLMKESNVPITAKVPGKDKGSFVWELALLLRSLKCAELEELNADGGRELTKHLFARARELNVPDTGAALQTPRVELPEVFYCRRSKDYWIASPNGLQPLNCEATKDHLAIGGLSSRPDDSGLSEVDRKLAEIRDYKAVDATMPLAGYPEGLHIVKGRPLLVPSSFKMIEPKVGEDRFPHIWAIISGLFGPQSVQVDHFMSKLKNDRACLMAGLKNGGLALLVAGDPGIGKTLVLDAIIKPALGGRSANVFANLSGSTPFSKEQAGSEVWYVDDGNPFTDHEARRAFANAIKQAVASAEVWAHGKGQDGITIALYRRLVVLTNIDSLDAMPEMEASLTDKIMLLKASKFPMPKGLLPLPPLWDVEKVKQFQNVLTEELPYFLDYVDHYDVPEYAQGSRFGVPYKNPELWEEIKALSRESEIHHLVQQFVYGTASGPMRGELLPNGAYRFEINTLFSAMAEHRLTSVHLRGHLRTSRALGNALGRVRRSELGKFYDYERSNSSSYWEIRRDDALKHSRCTGGCTEEEE